MITPIHIADLPQIHALCDRVNEQMDFSVFGYPYSNEAMKNSWLYVLQDPNHIKFCFNDGQIKGVFIARMQDHGYYMQGHVIASEVALHADPILPKLEQVRITLLLRKEAETRLKVQGVKTFYHTIHPSKFDMTANLEKHGYRCISKTMAKEF